MYAMHHDLTKREYRLGGGMNTNPIRVLDKEIKKLEDAAIELKRTRNSLLSVNKLPPEILGKIFHWNVKFEGDFDGLGEESHNFLFVCHLWSEVASCTQKLWSFWGNNPKHWARWCLRSETAPLDLVLSYRNDDRFNETVFNVLRDRASRDTIRRIHLEGDDQPVLDFILSSLTLEVQEIRSNRVESFILWNQHTTVPVDVSDFFARYHFPKLQRLDLHYCTISSWDNLMLRTGALTYLSLGFTHPTLNPTMSQLFSILESNPLLQSVKLSRYVVPDDGDDMSSLRLTLEHLKRLELVGDLRNILRLLDRLDNSEILESLVIILFDCTVTEISQILEPYYRNRFQRHGRPQSELGLYVRYDTKRIELRVGDFVRVDRGVVHVDKCLTLIIHQIQQFPANVQVEVVLKLIAHVPQEEVIYFRAVGDTMAMCDTYTRLPNLRTLHLNDIHLATLFSEHHLARDKSVLPAVENLILENLLLKDGDWSPLTTFLTSCALSGKPLKTLKISKSEDMCLGVVKSISGVVQEFDSDRDSDFFCDCFLCTCWWNHYSSPYSP